MSTQDIYKRDTVRIIQSGGVSVVVRSATVDYTTIPATESYTNLNSCTVQIFPVNVELDKQERGYVAGSTHKAYFPRTSSISVSTVNQFIVSGETDYHEVLGIGVYEGHLKVWTKRTEGRTT